MGPILAALFNLSQKYFFDPVEFINCLEKPSFLPKGALKDAKYQEICKRGA